ncbi:bacteriohemerythrin [Pseudomonadota bacterium]
MGLIEWNENRFSVLVDDMDEQHKQWINLINILHDSLIGEGSEITPETAIQEMLDYTRYHFKEEEQLMRDVQYPGFTTHKALHIGFIADLKTLEKDINSGHFVLRTQVMSILKSWLEDHITTEDKRYGEYISKTKT